MKPPALTCLLLALLALARPSLAQSTPPPPDVPSAIDTAIPAPVAIPEAAAPAPKEPAYSEAVTAALGSLEEGKARVVFFRPSKFAGAAIGFIVREQAAELGKLRSGWYFVINTEPGAHTYAVHTEATDTTTVELEAGETCFVAGSMSMGFMVGHPHLAVTDLAAFEAALPKLDRAKPLS
jgi:hypothetical protein